MARAPQAPKDRATTVPGLDSRAPCPARLSARSALFTELHLLLDNERAALTSAAYRALVITENKLSRSSASARGKLWEELKKRYRLDAEDPLFAAFWLEWRRCASEAERGLTAYVLLALNDRLVADLGKELLFPLLRRAPAELRVPDVQAFIERANNAHPEVRGWSEETRLAVAQKYGASIRDFGLAKGTNRKTTVRPALYGSSVQPLLARSGARGRCRRIGRRWRQICGPSRCRPLRRGSGCSSGARSRLLRASASRPKTRWTRRSTRSPAISRRKSARALRWW